MRVEDIYLYMTPHPNPTLFLNKMKYNKGKQKLTYQSWTKQPNRKKGVPRAGKRVRDTPSNTFRSPTKTPT